MPGEERLARELPQARGGQLGRFQDLGFEQHRVGRQWELRGVVARRDQSQALDLSLGSGCCRYSFEKQPEGRSRISAKGAEVGRRVRAELSARAGR
jgi:hypothetical protein